MTKAVGYLAIGGVPKPPTAKRRRAPWFSEETWCVIDVRVSLRREPTWYQTRIRNLGQKIRASLNVDMRQYEEETRSAVEYLLASNPPLFKEWWHQMWGWYKDTMDRTPPPLPQAALPMSPSHI